MYNVIKGDVLKLKMWRFFMEFKIRRGVLIKCIVKPGETEAIIPDGVTGIEPFAFFQCTSLIRHSRNCT